MTIGKVLVVEDDAIIRMDIAFVLEDMGYEVFKAKTAASALGIAKRESPLYIICDFNLPDGNGIEIAQTLKQEESLQGMRFILCSGSLFIDGELTIVDGYLAKPFYPKELMALMKKLSPGDNN